MPQPCSACPGHSAPTLPTANRSWHATVRTGRTCRRPRSSVPSTRKSGCSPSPSPRRWSCSPHPRCTSAAPATWPPAGRCASSATILVSGRPVVARDGRFGVYVTDGETNASIGRGDRIEEMTPERAFELLAVRREQVAAKGGAPKKAARGQEGAGQSEGEGEEAVTEAEESEPWPTPAVHRPRRSGRQRQEHPGRVAGRRARRRADPGDWRHGDRSQAAPDPPRQRCRSSSMPAPRR